MMRNIWAISDTHFSHENVLKFKDKNGDKIRNFDSVDEMNEHMIEKWNSVVKHNDIIYHCGDVHFTSNKLVEPIIKRLNGRKRLILGNHDHAKSPLLNRYFQKITAWRFFKEFNCVLTHFPILFNHEKVDFNVHGHTHQNLMGDGYINVCVECVDYTPINLEDVRDLNK